VDRALLILKHHDTGSEPIERSFWLPSAAVNHQEAALWPCCNDFPRISPKFRFEPLAANETEGSA
jgi:hypothetical protein